MNAFQKLRGVDAAAEAVLQQHSTMRDAAYEAKDTQARFRKYVQTLPIVGHEANGRPIYGKRDVIPASPFITARNITPGV